MKSLAWLTEGVLLDSGTRCGADPTMDIRTVRRRVEHEGDSFLTITLPAYGAALERALATGRLEPKATPMFHWHRRGLPEFLRGFLLLVFDKDGQLLPNPSVDAILCIRQICYLHKKILRPCSDARSKKALARFKECENELDQDSSSIHREHLNAYEMVAGILWSDILHDIPSGDLYEELHPHHGPGATRERIYGNSKFRFKRWHSRLEHHFPYSEFGIASILNKDVGSDGFNEVEFIEPEDEQPVRVVFVPKTQKTPRVIAIEPVCMQYMQQAFMRSLVPLIEGSRYCGGHVNFTDQSINGKLALASSRDGRLATLDLSEASDRVSSDLVWRMLKVAPVLRDQLFACRSTKAELPNGEILTLKKFASMGSALCFPMEAMVFYTIIVAARIVNAKLPITSSTVYRYSRDVYVYGDDILVPVDEAPLVGSWLSDFNLKVNDAKSFWTGKFRESCGVDAYDGENVTPTYLRHEIPTNKRSVDALASWVATANLFYQAGFWRVAKMMRQHVESILGRLPHMGTNASGFHWVTFSNATTWKRWNKTLMRFEVKTWCIRLTRRVDRLVGDYALLKCFAVIGQSATIATDHLERIVARGKQALQYRWVPAL